MESHGGETVISFVQPAGSEGELCHEDGLGSAGSSSTLASSVIEVEGERDEPSLTPQLLTNREEEEEEELTPLSPPPTLSITEEILEFINQSRAREGLTAILSDTTEQIQDQSKDSPSPSDQTNFTCPLPPVASPPTPEQRPTMQWEQEVAETENDVTLRNQTSENETTTNQVHDIPEATSQVENRAEEHGETRREVSEEDKEEKKVSDDEEERGIVPTPTPDLHPSILAEDERVTNSVSSSEAANTEATADVLHQPVQRRQPPTRRSHLSKRDKKIIEKIRSYYEAAAEAKEDESEEEDEPREGVVTRRRNSFSQIPSGLVKESVSRFDVGGHQGEPESSGQSKFEGAEALDNETDPYSSTDPVSSPTPLSADTDSDGQADKPMSSLDLNEGGPVESPTSTVMQDKETSIQNGPVEEEAETQDQNGNVRKGSPQEEPEEGQDGKTSALATGEQGGSSLEGEGPSVTKQHKCRDEPTKTGAVNQVIMNGHEPNQASPAEPNGSHEEPATLLPSAKQCQKTETKTQSNWARTKSRDLAKTSGNLEGLPGQIKVGLWSRHSRIVTANRALFEGVESNVAGIGLFEASPVVDPVLMENSERILSKVQTLARMYSAKASTMKVPLHQKLSGTVRNQSWVSARPSVLSTQSQTKRQIQAQAQVQTPVVSHQQTQMETKATTQTRQKSQIQTKSQNQTRTYGQFQTQTMREEVQMIQEKRLIQRAESRVDDFQETVMAPSEPLLFGHVFVREQLTPACHHQTSGFTLSRPRDFICALNNERDSSVGENAHTSTTPGENPLSSLARATGYDPGYTSTETPSASAQHLRASPEDRSSGFCRSASNGPLTSTSALDCRIIEFRDSSAVRGESLNQTEDANSATEVTQNREGSEQSGGLHVYSVGEESTSVNITAQPAHSDPSLSAPSSLKWNDKNEKDKTKQDEPAAMCTPEKPEYNIYMEHTDDKNVCAGPEDSEITNGEASTGELAPSEDRRSTKVHPGLRGEPAQRETLRLAKGDTTASGRPKNDEPPSETLKFDLNDSSGETVISPTPSQPSQVTFEPSQVYCHTETEEAPPSLRSSGQNSESNPTQRRPPSVDCLPTFTSQKPPDLPTTLGKHAPSNACNVNSANEWNHREPDEPSSGSSTSPPTPRTSSLVGRPDPDKDTDLTPVHSAFKPSHGHRSPSPVRAPPPSSPFPPPSSSARVPPCSSPFRVIPSSPTPASPGGFNSTNTISKALSCLSTTPSSDRVSSMRAPPASSPIPSTAFTLSSSSSSSGRSLSSRAGPPSSPSLFTRSLAASCISQSISQSMAKNNAALQQATPTVNQSPSSTPSFPSSHLQRGSPSPKLLPSQQGTSAPAYAQLGCTKGGYQHPRVPPSTLRSSGPSPSLMQPPLPSLSQRSPSPSMNPAHHEAPYSSSPPPRPSFLHSKTYSSQNSNNNNSISLAGGAGSCNINGGVSKGGWVASPQKAPLANGKDTVTVTQQTHDPLWSGSHNRVARPFSASEPSSRVQSPSPSPTPASFTRLCSPPPQHNYSSPMANKPPHPRSTRVGGAASHNPLGLTLELPRATSATSACLSPRILSPPPIGVSLNVWANTVAAPQPRNPRYPSSTPSPSFSSTLGSPTLEMASFPSSSPFVPRSRSRASSPSANCPPAYQSLRRSFSSSLADRPSSPGQSSTSGLRRSWADSTRRSLGFSGSGRGSFDQHESCPVSPRSGWSSYSSSPSCLSPRAGLQSPLSPSRLTPGKGTLGGQHFTSVPWPDVRELSSKYNGTDSPDTSATSTTIASSPAPSSSLSHTLLTSPVPSDSQTEWGDPEPEEGNCRSQLICAYVARPSREQNLSSPPYQHHNHQTQVIPQPQVQMTTTTPPIPSIPSPLPSRSSPLPYAQTSPAKQRNQKTSYATTVNLQIAGSGRITSFSTAQVSLTQTLQGGVGAGGPGQGQVARRVSINGLSHLPSPLSQNCNRL
ncbi:mucin-2 [Embiotoca jacksoni]|uniref:mucin-2 n=1 Tax=Embiotoca jacksoni TaxID=100190 RepID=UPI003704567D